MNVLFSIANKCIVPCSYYNQDIYGIDVAKQKLKDSAIFMYAGRI